MKKFYVLFAMIAFFSLSSFSLKFKDETSKLKEFGTIVKSDAKNNGFKKLVNEMPIKPQKKAVKGVKRNNKKNDEPKVEGLSLTGFILGLVGWFIPYLGLLMCILAIIFSAIGLGRTLKQPEKYKGKGFAITGLIMGILGVLITILVISAIAGLFLI
jgi:hypothetical protein